MPPRVFACRDLPLGNETEFEVGDRVQARWNGEPTYYVGTLTSVHPYAIDYDDGDHEDDVDASLIRASRLPDPPRYPAPDAAPPTCSTVLEGRDVGALCDAACFVSNDIFAAKGEDWMGMGVTIVDSLDSFLLLGLGGTPHSAPLLVQLQSQKRAEAELPRKLASEICRF